MPTRHGFGGRLGLLLGLLLLLLGVGRVRAHQLDLSTVVVSKTPEGQYVVQVTSALTAFEGEVKYRYPRSIYTTPEEFNALAIRHFRNSVRLVANGTDTLRFANPVVLLGHETRLVAEIVGLPVHLTSLHLQNAMFRDLPRNQSIAVLLLEGLPRQQYILSNDNQQQLTLHRVGGQWAEVHPGASAPGRPYGYLALLLLLAGGAGGLVLLRSRQQQAASLAGSR